MLKAAGLSCKFDSKRGWDHGVFVALKLLYPAADIPVVEMSLLDSLSAEVNAQLCADHAFCLFKIRLNTVLPKSLNFMVICYHNLVL